MTRVLSEPLGCWEWNSATGESAVLALQDCADVSAASRPPPDASAAVLGVCNQLIPATIDGKMLENTKAVVYQAILWASFGVQYSSTP